MSIAVRQLAIADVEAFRALRLEALADSPEAFGGDFADESQQPLENFTRQITHSAIFGAFDGDVLCGLTGLFWNEGAKTRHSANIYTVYVTPTARGTGCSLGLIEAALDHARSLGRIQVFLGVSTHNAPAVALYKKAGFVVYGTEPRALYVNGRYIDEYLMVRLLDEAPGKNEHE